MKAARRAIATFLVGTLCFGAAPVAAQGVPDLVALGKQEFEVGQREFNLGHYEAALGHFEASYRLTARPGLLYNLGYTARQLFVRTRKLELLELAIERFRAALASLPESDPAARGVRDRTQTELRSAELELAAEQAARARGEETLAVGEQLLRKGQVGAAREQLERYLSSAERERGGVARAWLLEGSLAVAEGRVERAVEAYANGISLDRAQRLDATSPEVARQAYARAVEKLGPVPPLGLRHTPSGGLKLGQPVVLSFENVSDPQHLVAGLRLFYRTGNGAYSSLPPQPIGKLMLPSLFTSALQPGAHIDYYAMALDAQDAVLEHLGSASLPFSVEIERPRARSVARRPWFWVVLGLSAAAVATGIGLAVHYTQPPSYDVPVHITGLRAP